MPVRERALQSDVVLIATGSRPFRPRDMPFDDPDVHDSETVLDIDQPFTSLVVVGEGPWDGIRLDLHRARRRGDTRRLR